MDITFIKTMLHAWIVSTQKISDDKCRNGDDNLCEQVEITTLRDVLNSIEDYEVNENKSFSPAALVALTAVHEANERREIILPTKTAALIWESLLLAHNGDISALRLARNEGFTDIDNDATGEK